MIDLGVNRLEQLDPSGWTDDAVKLIGATGFGLLLREIVKQVFARANKQDDNASTARADLYRQLTALVERVDILDARVEAERQRANQLFADNAQLRAENSQLRRRYHDLIGWIAAQPGMPTPPSWLYERIEGPTQRDAAPKPPEGSS